MCVCGHNIICGPNIVCRQSIGCGQNIRAMTGYGHASNAWNCPCFFVKSQNFFIKNGYNYTSLKGGLKTISTGANSIIVKQKVYQESLFLYFLADRRQKPFKI